MNNHFLFGAKSLYTVQSTWIVLLTCSKANDLGGNWHKGRIYNYILLKGYICSLNIYVSLDISVQLSDLISEASLLNKQWQMQRLLAGHTDESWQVLSEQLYMSHLQIRPSPKR